MATKSPTFRLHLFPTTPLEAQQRSYHRLRSSRKLEAVRGITPLFLDLDSRVDDIISDTSTLARISPRTRATRRKGRIFNSPSSPTSSIESDYVFVNARILSDLYLHSPSSSRSPSPSGNPVTNDNRNLGVWSGDRNKTIDTEGPQPLAQPYLLQLPTLPVPPTISINSNEPPVHHPEQQQPMSSSFNIYSNTTSSYPRHGQLLTETEKRRKLAKLARTLGENIPPELVFHASPPPIQRSISTSSSRTRRYHKPSPSLAVPISPPSPLSSIISLSTPPTPTSPSPTIEAKTAVTPVQPPRLARPQSMTLTKASPAMATPSTRGASLDGVPSDHAPFQGITVTATESTERSNASGLEWNKRKGQGWSGEWNRDMKHVAKALRGLKAR